MPAPVETVNPPRCACGGMIRPNVVWFGEALPSEAWDRSVEAVANADVAIVVGTSAVVYPAAGLPEMALANGVPVIEVNPEATALSASATLSLRETAATALPTLLQRLPALLG
jgi:NAD-dependent deacetylase